MHWRRTVKNKRPVEAYLGDVVVHPAEVPRELRPRDFDGVRLFVNCVLGLTAAIVISTLLVTLGVIVTGRPKAHAYESNQVVWVVLYTFTGAGFSIDVAPFANVRHSYPTELICKRHLKDVQGSLREMRSKVEQISYALPVTMSEPRCVALSGREK